MWWSCLTPKLVRVHHRGAPIQRCPNTCVLPAAHAKVLGAASAQASNGEPLAAPAIIAGIKNYVRATEGGAMRAAQSPHHAGRHARGARGGGGGNGAGKSSLAASMWRSVLEQGMQPSSPMPAPPRPGSGARTPTHSRSTPTFGSGRTGPQIQRRNNPAASMVRPCRARRVLWLAPHSCNCVAPCCSPRHLRLLSHPHRPSLPYQPYVAVSADASGLGIHAVPTCLLRVVLSPTQLVRSRTSMYSLRQEARRKQRQRSADMGVPLAAHVFPGSRILSGPEAKTLYHCLPLTFIEETTGRQQHGGFLCAGHVLTQLSLGFVAADGTITEFATYMQCRLGFATYNNYPATLAYVPAAVAVRGGHCVTVVFAASLRGSLKARASTVPRLSLHAWGTTCLEASPRMPGICTYPRRMTLT